jgi:serine/threonine protein phosphatase 1
MTIEIQISDWKSAPFQLNGETVFAVGDIHGCAAHLSALQTTISTLAVDSRGPRRLVYLGDVIDRGPSTTEVLALWAQPAEELGVTHIDRLLGNHEIMMLMALSDFPQAKTFEALWLTPGAGGLTFLEEMRALCNDPVAPPSYALAEAALGERIVRLLPIQRGHVRVGNALFVHAGVRGGSPIESFLAPPWTAGREARWAWITEGFLDWQGGFDGTIVVHGHSPPAKHFPLTGMEDPHLFQHDRLGLDGGSARTGVVVAAEIQDGRYRILKARGDSSPA